MKLFKNRTVLGIFCIVISLMVCFVISPMISRGFASKTSIVRVKSPVKNGTMITDKMIVQVEVGGYNLPENVVKDADEVVGKYATADLYSGDYVLAEKLSETPAKENEYLYNLDGKKQAMSITLNTFAEGVSGKLMSGDIVSVIIPDYNGLGDTIIPTELKYVEVIAVTAKSGYDANTETNVRESEDDQKELPSTVTMLVTPEQSKILAMFEEDGEMHLSLVYRGEESVAKKFIEAQDEVLLQIQEMMEEANESLNEEDMQVVGETGTTIVSGMTRRNSGNVIIQGNKIATMPLPANASTGAVNVSQAGAIISQ